MIALILQKRASSSHPALFRVVMLLRLCLGEYCSQNIAWEPFLTFAFDRMYDVNGNRINVNKKDDERGNASAFSPSETGYGMPRSRAGMPASKSTISKSLRRLSGGSGATGLSFRSGRTGRSAGTGISATSFGKKSAPSSYAPTSVSRNVPRKVDDATSFTGRSYSSSRLAPRSLGRTAPLSVKSGRSSRRRGFDEESAFSDETDGSDARSRGSSALTSRTAGTRLGGSTFKSSAFSGKSSALRGGLKLSKSDYSRSGFTSSAGPGKGSRKIPRPRDSRGLSDIDEEESEVLLDEPSSYAGRDYVRGGAGSSTLAPNSRTGITLAASDLTGTSYNGSGIRMSTLPIRPCCSHTDDLGLMSSSRWPLGALNEPQAHITIVDTCVLL